MIAKINPKNNRGMTVEDEDMLSMSSINFLSLTEGLGVPQW